MRNDKAKVAIDQEARSAKWVFANGVEVKVALDSLPPTTVVRLALFGLKTKLSNTYAGEPILSASIKNFERGLQALRDNIWSTGTTRVSLLARAVARVQGVSIEDAIAAIAKLGKGPLKQLRGHSGIKYAMAKIQLEDAEVEGTDEAFDLDIFLDVAEAEEAPDPFDE